jgi:hypothetical protein
VHSYPRSRSRASPSRGQSQGLTLEEVMANIKEAAELYLETLQG